MEAIRAIGAASRGVWYELRCYWCEVLVGWALKVRPADYVPGIIEATLAHKADPHLKSGT